MRKRDKRMELALTVYQTLADMRGNGLDGMATKRCDALLNRVLTVFEEEFKSAGK